MQTFSTKMMGHENCIRFVLNRANSYIKISQTFLLRKHFASQKNLLVNLIKCKSPQL